MPEGIKPGTPYPPPPPRPGSAAEIKQYSVTLPEAYWLLVLTACQNQVIVHPEKMKRDEFEYAARQILRSIADHYVAVKES